jgi:hypothetical protein
LFVARKKYFFSNKINVSGQKKKLKVRSNSQAPSKDTTPSPSWTSAAMRLVRIPGIMTAKLHG